jgi:hypothetical protein
MRWRVAWAAAVAAFALTGCNARPASEGPECHYVGCGDLVDGYDEPRCAVVVNNRYVASFATGQEALDFIRKNELKTCAWEGSR